MPMERRSQYVCRLCIAYSRLLK